MKISVIDQNCFLVNCGGCVSGGQGHNVDSRNLY
jgi:hypothetical protein